MKCSLARFMSTFRDNTSKQTEEDTKGMFPHGCVQKLSDVYRSIESIKYRDFSDMLAGFNTLNKPYRDYCHLRHLGNTEEQALKKLNLKKRPIAGKDQYLLVQREWYQKGYQRIKDLLSNYCERDTRPFYRSIVAFIQAFETLGMGDLLSGYVSLAQARDD